MTFAEAAHRSGRYPPDAEAELARDADDERQKQTEWPQS
jgi:hypothetical protein